MSARNSKAQSISLRGFSCSSGFGGIRELYAKVSPFFDATFEAGFRVPSVDPQEWDFRKVRTPEEARECFLYECAREVEWLYDLRAQFAAACSFPKGSRMGNEALQRFVESWPKKEGLYCPDPLLGMQGHAANLPFPYPWMLYEEELRATGKMSEPRGIVSIPPASIQDASEWGSYRIHSVDIDWSLPPSALWKAFKAWEKEQRPPDIKISQQRGRDPKDIFTKLKMLAAYRLRRAGLSRTRAQELIEDREKTAPLETECTILPRYSSDGRWATDTGQVGKWLREWFPDPRAA